MALEKLICTFKLANQLFGIDIHDVKEIVYSQEIVKIPLAPPNIAGLLHLRGQVVTAIDLKSKLNINTQNDSSLSCNIVLKVEDGTISLLVEEISEVVELEPNLPKVELENGIQLQEEYIETIVPYKKEKVIILNTQKLVSIGS